MIASCHSSIDLQPAINLQSLAMIELHQEVETFEDNRGKIVSAGNQMCLFFSLALPDENSFLESIGPFTQWIPREAQLAYRSPVSAEYPIKRTHSHKAVIQSFHLFSSYSKFFYHYSAFSISVSEDQLS